MSLDLKLLSHSFILFISFEDTAPHTCFVRINTLKIKYHPRVLCE